MTDGVRDACERCGAERGCGGPGAPATPDEAWRDLVPALWCPTCGAARTHDGADGAPRYYCRCPGFGAGAT